MLINLTDRFKELFVKDRYGFWFNRFSDEEKELRRMDSWELAEIIQEETIKKRDIKKLIIAEHMLQVRLVKMHNNAIYLSIIFGLVGVLLGVILS
jgi:hypothetical protein